MTNHDIIKASDWVPIADIAKRAGVTRQAIHKAIRAGHIRSYQFGPRNVLINKRDAERYVQSKLKRAG